MVTQKTQSTNTRKIAAIAAGALVVGVGVTYTLATWNDSEWVWGGADGAPGIGTSSFNVQQNTTTPFNADAWVDEEEAPGGSLTFAVNPMALTPGDTVYAPVSLRTETTSIGGDVTLQAAISAAGLEDGAQTIETSDADDALWNAVEVSVWTSTGETPLTCDAATLGEWGTAIVDGQSLATATPASASQNLVAEAGSQQNYCFALTLPGDPESDLNQDLQGRTIAPAWEFQAVSE